MSSCKDRAVITLTTDFGLADDYAGTLKGAILCHCRQAAIIDLTHAIPPQDIVAAATSIGHSFRFFPNGSVHLVIVDPGVGSQRRILALRAADHLFIAPDNGVLTPFLTEACFQEAFQVNNRELFPETVSATFHGRDIMAPIAAMLACGMDISLAGPQLSRQECLQISLPAARVSAEGIIGEVVHIDHFGNLRTSITARDLAALPAGAGLSISLRGRAIATVSTTYSDAAPGALIALIDSREHLEIALVCGNAALVLGCKLGDRISVTTGKCKKNQTASHRNR